VIATSATPPGLPGELRLAGLSQADLAEALGEPGEKEGHALWVASRGLPGVARALAGELAGLAGNQDPVVHLDLRAVPTTAFLDVDANRVRLLELAAERAGDDATRARVLARLAGELLGDAAAAARRRALADEALRLARRTGEPGTLAEVLDARLHALWDPAGAEARLAAGSEIIDLARAAGDDRRERHGQFWRRRPGERRRRRAPGRNVSTAGIRRGRAGPAREPGGPGRARPARPGRDASSSGRR
jgi:hypothetical protein